MYYTILRAAFVAVLTLVSHAALALPAVDVVKGQDCYTILVDSRYPPALTEEQVRDCETSIDTIKTRSLLVMYQAGLPSEEMDAFVEKMLRKWHPDVYNPDTDSVAVVSNYPRYVRFFPPGKLHTKINPAKIFQATTGPRYQQVLAVLGKINQAYQAQVEEEGRLRTELDAANTKVRELTDSHVQALADLRAELDAQRNAALATLQSKYNADWWRRTIAEAVAAVIAILLFVIVAYIRARRRGQILRERLVGFKRFLEEVLARLPNNNAFQKHLAWEGQTQALLVVLANRVNLLLESSRGTLAEVEAFLRRGNFSPGDIEKILLKVHDLNLDTNQLEKEWRHFTSEVERAKKLSLAQMNTRADEIMALYVHNEYRVLALNEIAHLRQEVEARFAALGQDPFGQLEELAEGEKDFLNLLSRFSLLARRLIRLKRLKGEGFVNGFLIRMVRTHAYSLETILLESWRIITNDNQ